MNESVQPTKEDLRVEYSQRFAYQAHLTDRRWKANGLYFVIFGFSLNAIRNHLSPEFGLAVSAFNLIAIICTSAYDITVRNRILKNMDRAQTVASMLGIEAFVHYKGIKQQRLFRPDGNSMWYICLLLTCALMWTGLLIHAGSVKGIPIFQALYRFISNAF